MRKKPWHIKTNIIGWKKEHSDHSMQGQLSHVQYGAAEIN